ncbi:MAG: RNA polymerase sigma factor [Cytophagaceae bacterium]
MKFKDQDILKAIKNGNDHKALESLYRDLYPKIKKLVNSGEEAEEECKDILQESLLVFYKQVMLNKFDEKYEIGGFIYTIAKNLWINRVKKKKRQINYEPGQLPELMDSNVLETMELEERRVMVQNIFSRLEEKCKKLLSLTIYEELSMKEVCEKLGFTSVNAATVASFRCKKNLIDLIKKQKSVYTNQN